MTAKQFKYDILPVKDKLFRMAKRILNDADAEDIVQEVFYRLWKRRDEIQKYRSVEAFAMVVTKNLCLDKIKSKAYKSSDLTEWNEPTDNNSPEKIAERNDEIKTVHELIQKLPKQQRMIIQMRDVEGMDYDEITEVMNMNTNAVRVSLSRARKSIRDHLIKKHNYEYQGN